MPFCLKAAVQQIVVVLHSGCLSRRISARGQSRRFCDVRHSPLSRQQRTCGFAVHQVMSAVIQGVKEELRIMRYELRDLEWDVINPLLPNKPRGVPRVDDRRVLYGIFWVLRSGAPWRDLPETYGPYTTCYNRFVRWRKVGCLGSADGGDHRRPRCRCADDRQLVRAGAPTWGPASRRTESSTWAVRAGD